MSSVSPIIVAMFAALAIGLVTMLLLFQAGAARDAGQMKKRLSRVRARSGGQPDAIEQLARLRRDQGSAQLRGLESLAQRLLPNPALFRQRLQRTGRDISLGQYALICVVVGVAAAIAEMIFLQLPLSLGVLLGIAAGAGVPHVGISFLIRQRTKKFIAEFPDAIDLIIRGLRSGLPVPESIRAVGREFDEPVGTEFSAIADRLRLGQTLEDSLWDVAHKLDIPEFNFFVISLSVQRETGGNLAETLENLSDILRKRRQMQLKIKAMSSEAKASAMILGSLPFIMFALLYMLNPGYVGQLLTDYRGWYMLGGGAAFLMMGVGVMMKMVRFEI